jgi:hypothetical protein
MEKLLIGFSGTLKRLSDEKIFISTTTTTTPPQIMKIPDVTSSFRLLQLVEHILFTTQNEPWIEVIKYL